MKEQTLSQEFIFSGSINSREEWFESRTKHAVTLERKKENKKWLVRKTMQRERLLSLSLYSEERGGMWVAEAVIKVAIMDSYVPSSAPFKALCLFEF